ncbi:MULTISPECIES: PQQ-binding-like beta-propeller repeat protein [unclassified Streptomyces]|uniref:outer membrane protein assembly factor BamB family protein n=1 Tax=unclassified Streptomyces TaxID=2593676 RepID=UPI002E19D3CD|nr:MULTISPECIES: PQQ-binding-like beta-propeller repeat protein [unclassified Streptomyces]
MTTPGYPNGTPPAPGQQPYNSPYPPQQGYAPQQPYPSQQPQQGYAPQQAQQGFMPQQTQQGFAPQQFTPVHPPSSTPGKKRGKVLMIFLLVLSVIMSGVFGSVAWILLDPTKTEVEWSLPYYGGESDTQNYLGTWFTGKNVIRAQTDGVSALDADSGDLQWGMAAPGKGASTICHASSVSSEDIAILAVGAVHDCNGLFALDLKTGKKLWQHKISKRQDGPSTAVSGGTVVVNDKIAYDLRTGKQLWKDSKKETYGGKPCEGQGYVGGKQLVRVQLCTTRWAYGSPDGQSSTAAGVDPATGKAKWTYAMGDGEWEYGEDATVVSTSPVIVGVPQDIKKNGYTVLQDDGKARNTMVLGEDLEAYSSADSYFSQQEAATEGDPRAALKVIGNTLYIAEKHDGSGLGSAIDAYDLDSGKRVWSTGTSEGVEYSLVQGSGDELLALKQDDSGWREENFGGDGYPMYLVSIDPKSGSETQKQYYGKLDGALGQDGWAMPYVHDGSMFLASVSNTGKSSVVSEAHEASLIKMSD